MSSGINPSPLNLLSSLSLSLPSSSSSLKRQRSSDAGDSPSSQSEPPTKIRRLDSSENAPRPAFRLHLSESFSDVLKVDEVAELSQEIVEKVLSQPPLLSLRFDADAQQGKRPSMEDAHFIIEMDQGYLFCIFDGHGGSKVAKMAANYFRTHFPRLIQEQPDQTEMHFRTLSHDFQASVKEPMGGTTALMCFVDTSTHELIAGGVGDSEVTVFRKVDDHIEHFTLPTKKNWEDPEEAKRARLAFNNPEIFAKWMALPAKSRYFPPRGINVSRSLGDKWCVYEGRSAIIPTPITARFALQLGDLVLPACDGLWDFVTPENLAENVLLPHWDEPHLGKKITEYALKTSTDNVSVICASVVDAMLEEESTGSTQSYDSET